ncbi:MAG: NADH-quinone oxidoreductase subunit H [Candidatus Euphemobacter frigidus]|nr:NADH-quinone oxidoreductase subunit H [Candidatus Euphemobacter frigidus]MDP8275641.1 NADH-quinone oxidoreductase subunit H [Candidatus Euphemobacter frigidus]
MTSLWLIIGYVVLAPLIGGIISGLDRIITARMQGRYGPPVRQAFFDVFKLFEKQNLTVNRFHGYYLVCFLIFIIFSGILFFGGSDLLMVVFAFTVADIFLVLAAYSTNSPYCSIGAERELLQMLAAEPMLLLTAVGFYMVFGSFHVSVIYRAALGGKLPILYLPGVFLGLTYVLTIKFRKSPFDLSTSHHAHQELIKGLTTEFAGPSLALIEIAHWYETVLLLGMVYLFFAFVPIIGVIITLFIYFVEILIDNTNARIKWQLMLESAWLATLVLGGLNLLALYLFAMISKGG